MSRDPFEPWQPPRRQPESGPPNPFEPRPSEVRPAPVPVNLRVDFNPPLRGVPIRVVVLLLGLLALAVLAVVGLVVLPSGHGSRLSVSLLALALGLGIGLLWNAARWFVRLALFMAGLGAAAAAWWFVPTSQGLSLWSAHEQADVLVERLRQVPACDVAAFRKDQADRDSLIAQFPSFEPALAEAETVWLDRSTLRWEQDLRQLAAKDVAGFQAIQAGYLPHLGRPPFSTNRARFDLAENEWIDRSVTAWVADLNRIAPLDHAAFEACREQSSSITHWRLDAAQLAWLVRSYQKLKPGDLAGLNRLRTSAGPKHRLAGLVQKAEASWADRTVDHVLAATAPLLRTDPARASARLRQAAQDLMEFAGADQRLRPARQQAIQARLKSTYRRVWQLVTEDVTRDRAREVEAMADSLVAEIRPEAQTLAMTTALTDFRAKCKFLGKLSQSAARPQKRP